MTPMTPEATVSDPDAVPSSGSAPEISQAGPQDTSQEESPDQPASPGGKAHQRPPVQPVLEKLFELYPHLFGAEFLPLKLGIFQELLAAHPEHFERASLKAALGLHTRSTRYLQSVAAGNKRHDLQGAAIDDVAPEHIYLSLLELFRRRQARAREDLRPKFRAQLVQAYVASGLSRQDYVARVQTSEAEATALLEEALAEHDGKVAKQDALVRAFKSSGETVEAFADMYGMNVREVKATLETSRRASGA